MADDDAPNPRRSPADAVRWVFRTDHEFVVFVREMVSSALAVLLVGMLLFGVSGLWPPLVAVESGSMQPHMQRGDLVFVTEEHRFAGDMGYADTGVITHEMAEDVDYQRFGGYGDVVVYQRDGAGGTTPIIHRARFWVADGENWYDRANPAYVDGESCAAIANCPAPHAGFVTKGDNNQYYDQVNGISSPVKPEWVRGRAQFRVPWLGYVRLVFSGEATVGEAVTELVS
ncbi:S26 family signal peptidase [Salarchaeum japonicum]|uniref:S26 family signal peptidase n=1 Tax=Salarchaeum japonicum TaxID=555573 RepID=A0AAV3T0T6_9EURY|nr:S26 family signal peptidase [Salarchaeum japonicum]